MGKENYSQQIVDGMHYVIVMTDEGAFFIERESDGIVISPLFVSEFGAKKWLHYQIANDMLQHRMYQFGMDCLMFLEGEYFWQDDLNEKFFGPVFNDYTKAIKWRWKQKR